MFAQVACWRMAVAYPTGSVLIFRTDYSDSDAEWRQLIDVVTELTRGESDFTFVDDRAFEGADRGFLARLAKDSGGDYNDFAYVADCRTLSSPEYPILVVDLLAGEDSAELAELRVIPRMLSSVVDNLLIGNLDPEDFIDASDDDGVLRGI